MPVPEQHQQSSSLAGSDQAGHGSLYKSVDLLRQWLINQEAETNTTAETTMCASRSFMEQSYTLKRSESTHMPNAEESFWDIDDDDDDDDKVEPRAKSCHSTATIKRQMSLLEYTWGPAPQWRPVKWQTREARLDQLRVMHNCPRYTKGTLGAYFENIERRRREELERAQTQPGAITLTGFVVQEEASNKRDGIGETSHVMSIKRKAKRAMAGDGREDKAKKPRRFPQDCDASRCHEVICNSAITASTTEWRISRRRPRGEVDGGQDGVIAGDHIANGGSEVDLVLPSPKRIKWMTVDT